MLPPPLLPPPSPLAGAVAVVRLLRVQRRMQLTSLPHRSRHQHHQHVTCSVTCAATMQPRGSAATARRTSTTATTVSKGRTRRLVPRLCAHIEPLMFLLMFLFVPTRLRAGGGSRATRPGEMRTGLGGVASVGPPSRGMGLECTHSSRLLLRLSQFGGYRNLGERTWSEHPPDRAPCAHFTLRLGPRGSDRWTRASRRLGCW